MSNKTLIGGVIVLLLAVGAWYLIVVRGVGRTPPAPPVVAPPAVEEPSPLQPAPPGTSGQLPGTPDPERELKVLALTFAERYGSYSTDAAFANLKRLGSLITPAYASEIESTITKGVTPGIGGFYSVTTKALSGSLRLVSESSAVVDVSAQRQEIFSRGGEVRLAYQTLVVTLERESGQWLVGGARWKE